LILNYGLEGMWSEGGNGAYQRITAVSAVMILVNMNLMANVKV
jgi:hypothetical protein